MNTTHIPPPPPVGYRPLKDGEKIERGDIYYNTAKRKWLQVIRALGMEWDGGDVYSAMARPIVKE